MSISFNKRIQLHINVLMCSGIEEEEKTRIKALFKQAAPKASTAYLIYKPTNPALSINAGSIFKAQPKHIRAPLEDLYNDYSKKYHTAINEFEKAMKAKYEDNFNMLMKNIGNYDAEKVAIPKSLNFETLLDSDVRNNPPSESRATPK